MPKIASDSLRILIILPTLCGEGSFSLGEISKRFDYPIKQLMKDLMSAALIGDSADTQRNMPEIFWPDEMTDAFEKNLKPDPEWSISVSQTGEFEKPPALTTEEILRLLLIDAQLKTLGGSESSDFSRAIHKIQQVVAAEVEVEFDAQQLPTKPNKVNDLEAMAGKNMQAQIDYLSYSGGTRQTRTIEPWVIFFSHNEWYVRGYCHTAAGPRTFNLSRIAEIVPTATAFSMPIPEEEIRSLGSNYTANPNDPVAQIELAPEAAWIMDEISEISAIKLLKNRKTHITISVSNPQFLNEILLKVGVHGRIVSGDFAEDTGSKAALGILKARYGA